MTAKANDGKHLVIEVDGVRYQRIPLRTKLIGPDDDLIQEVASVVEGKLEDGDLLFVTEKIVAITQGRSLPIDSIVPRPLAIRLSGRVTKTPAGIGLRFKKRAKASQLMARRTARRAPPRPCRSAPRAGNRRP